MLGRWVSLSFSLQISPEYSGCLILLWEKVRPPPPLHEMQHSHGPNRSGNNTLAVLHSPGPDFLPHVSYTCYTQNKNSVCLAVVSDGIWSFLKVAFLVFVVPVRVFHPSIPYIEKLLIRIFRRTVKIVQ